MVVIGVAGSQLIMRLLASEDVWHRRIFNVLALWSLGVIARSLGREIQF